MTDEEILRLREAAREMEQQNEDGKMNSRSGSGEYGLQEGVPASLVSPDEVLTAGWGSFVEKILFSDQIAIRLPEDFEEFSPEEIAEIYLLGNRPDMVFGKRSPRFSAGFHHTQEMIPDAYMGDFSRIARLMLEQAGPGVRVLSEKIRETDRHTVSALELVSHTITDTYYNLMFFASLEERVLIGFINFDYEFLEELRPAAREIMESFRFTDEESGTGAFGEVEER